MEGWMKPLKNLDIVLVGPASRRLGGGLRGQGFNVAELEYRVFPDGESYLRVPVDIKGLNVAVLQSTYPPQDKHLIELFLALTAARELGAEEVVAAVPYLAYARQDSMFKPGESVSLKTIIKLIEDCGTSAFITFNIHKADRMKWFKIPSLNLSAVKAIADHLATFELSNPVVIAPDRGAAHLAEEASSILKAEHTYLEKRRDRETGSVETSYRELDVSGRDVIIIDDIISSGSTIANVAEIASRQGAKRIMAACIHPLLAEGALERMERAGVSKVLGTDCVEGAYSEVSVAPLLAEALRTML
ncbi:MAG: ribose-phosphate diphosphokinase [Candidatus Bathyarchaeia archaeon]